VRSRNLAIVFAGLCGYAERLGAQTWEESQRMLRLHEALVDPVLRKFKGRRIKQIAGTFLVAFESPTQAVLCAAALQHRARRMELDVRIGIHLGEVRLARGDVFGEPVNIAARIEALCGPGEVLFGESVWLSMNRAEVHADDAGERRLKGVPEPVRVFRLLSALKPLPDLGPLPSPDRPEVRGELRRHLFDAAQVAIRKAENVLGRSVTGDTMAGQAPRDGVPGAVRVFVGAGLAAMLAVAAFFALARLGALP